METDAQIYHHEHSIDEVDCIGERSCGSSDMEDAQICWICLDSSGELIYPCKCPRCAHHKCLARWQLQSAGTRKEWYCEFCDTQLPDWKAALTPTSGAAAPAVMNVNFDGRTYSFEVKPGPDGYKLFTESIRRAFNLPDDSELNITFTCDEPTVPEPGSLLTLQGPGAYDAAVHCASVSAGRRMPTPTSQSLSQISELDSAPPLTPRSPFGLSSAPSYNTPSPFEGGLPPATDSVSGASVDANGGGPGGSNSKQQRRLSGFGKKIRTALTDLLAKQ